MKQKILSGLLFAVLALLLSSSAWAITYTFEDTVNYFPGYTNGTNDDKWDELGTPKVGTMLVSVNDISREITTITLQVEDRRVWDTLFINQELTPGEAWDAWDYIVRDNDGGTSWVTPGEVPTIDSGLYSVKNPSSYSYTFVQTISGREKHPNGINKDDLALVHGGDSFIEWTNDILTYDLSSFHITLGNNFNIAYAPWCANDVTTTVPEPATIILMGLGLIGLAGTIRKKINK